MGRIGEVSEELLRQTHMLKSIKRNHTHHTDKGEVGGSSPPRPTI